MSTNNPLTKVHTVPEIKSKFIQSTVRDDYVYITKSGKKEIKPQALKEIKKRLIDNILTQK